MAIDKNLESLDGDMDLTSLDQLADPMSFDLDDPQVGGRKPASPTKEMLGGILKATASGAKDAVKTEIGRRLPKTSALAGELVQTFDEFQQMRQEFSRKLQPALTSIEISTAKILPSMKRLVPKRLYDKIDRKLKMRADARRAGTGIRPRTKEERENDAIDASIADVFSDNIEFQQTQAVEERKNNMINQALASTRSKNVENRLIEIYTTTRFQASFMKTTQTAYMKKSLELKYRQLFMLKDIYQTVSGMGQVMEGNLKAIVQNTGLPDAQKITTTERIKDAYMKETYDKWGQRISGYVSTFRGKLLKNVKDKAFGSLTGGLSNFASQLGMVADGMEMGRESGMGDAGPGIAASIIGNILGNVIGTAGIRNIADKIQPFANDMEGAMGDVKVNTIMRLANWRKELAGSPGVKGWLADLIPDFSAASTGTNKLVTGGTEAMRFDNITRQSIVEIIPGWLGKIHQEISSMRTGTDQEEQVFDYYSRTFKTVSQMRDTVFTRMMGTKDQRSRDINAAIGTIQSGYTRARTGQMKNATEEQIAEERSASAKSVSTLRGPLARIIANIGTRAVGEFNINEIRDYVTSTKENPYFDAKGYIGLITKDVNEKDAKAALTLLVDAIYPNGQYDKRMFELIRTSINRQAARDSYKSDMPIFTEERGMRRFFSDIINEQDQIDLTPIINEQIKDVEASSKEQIDESANTADTRIRQSNAIRQHLISKLGEIGSKITAGASDALLMIYNYLDKKGVPPEGILRASEQLSRASIGEYKYIVLRFLNRHGVVVGNEEDVIAEAEHLQEQEAAYNEEGLSREERIKQRLQPLNDAKEKAVNTSREARDRAYELYGDMKQSPVETIKNIFGDAVSGIKEDISGFWRSRKEQSKLKRERESSLNSDAVTPPTTSLSPETQVVVNEARRQSSIQTTGSPVSTSSEIPIGVRPDTPTSTRPSVVPVMPEPEDRKEERDVTPVTPTTKDEVPTVRTVPVEAPTPVAAPVVTSKIEFPSEITAKVPSFDEFYTEWKQISEERHLQNLNGHQLTKMAIEDGSTKIVEILTNGVPSSNEKDTGKKRTAAAAAIDMAGRAVGGLFNFYKNTYAGVGKAAYRLASGLIGGDASPYQDLYLKDRVALGSPLLSAKKQATAPGVVFADDQKRVMNSKDINRPVIDPVTGQVLISEEDLKIGIVTVSNKPINRLLSMAGGLTNTALKGAASLGSAYLGFYGSVIKGTGSAIGGLLGGRRGKDQPYVNIYRKDNVDPGKPLLSRRRQQQGVQFQNGSRVERSEDIIEPVFDPETKECLITQEDINAGLVNVDNKPLGSGYAGGKGTGILSSLAKGFGGLLKGAGKAGGSIVGMYADIYKKLFSGTVDTVKNGFGWLFGTGKHNEKRLKPVTERLDKMMDILNGSYKIQKELLDIWKDDGSKKKNFSDKDGDGDRDGSYEDIIENRRRSGIGIGDEFGINGEDDMSDSENGSNDKNGEGEGGLLSKVVGGYIGAKFAKSAIGKTFRFKKKAIDRLSKGSWWKRQAIRTRYLTRAKTYKDIWRHGTKPIKTATRATVNFVKNPKSIKNAWNVGKKFFGKGGKKGLILGGLAIAGTATGLYAMSGDKNLDRAKEANINAIKEAMDGMSDEDRAAAAQTIADIQEAETEAQVTQLYSNLQSSVGETQSTETESTETSSAQTVTGDEMTPAQRENVRKQLADAGVRYTGDGQQSSTVTPPVSPMKFGVSPDTNKSAIREPEAVKAATDIVGPVAVQVTRAAAPKRKPRLGNVSYERDTSIGVFDDDAYDAKYKTNTAANLYEGATEFAGDAAITAGGTALVKRGLQATGLIQKALPAAQAAASTANAASTTANVTSTAAKTAGILSKVSGAAGTVSKVAGKAAAPLAVAGLAYGAYDAATMTPAQRKAWEESLKNKSTARKIWDIGSNPVEQARVLVNTGRTLGEIGSAWSDAAKGEANNRRLQAKLNKSLFDKSNLIKNEYLRNQYLKNWEIYVRTSADNPKERKTHHNAYLAMLKIRTDWQKKEEEAKKAIPPEETPKKPEASPTPTPEQGDSPTLQTDAQGNTIGGRELTTDEKANIRRQLFGGGPTPTPEQGKVQPSTVRTDESVIPTKRASSRPMAMPNPIPSQPVLERKSKILPEEVKVKSAAINQQQQNEQMNKNLIELNKTLQTVSGSKQQLDVQKSVDMIAALLKQISDKNGLKVAGVDDMVKKQDALLKKETPAPIVMAPPATVIPIETHEDQGINLRKK